MKFGTEVGDSCVCVCVFVCVCVCVGVVQSVSLFVTHSLTDLLTQLTHTLNSLARCQLHTHTLFSLSLSLTHSLSPHSSLRTQVQITERFLF